VVTQVPNQRLLDALLRQRITPDKLAEELGVDPKTVERWISKGRQPYARHRYAISSRLGEPESWLWPDAVSEREGTGSDSELVRLIPRRASISGDLWFEIFSDATTFVDVLVYAGLFLPEQTPAVVELLRDKAREGARVRLLMGDPACAAVALRGEEEGIGDAVATKVHNALKLIRRLLGETSGVQVRLHDTTLYTSIYRADDTMIANPHVLGLPAAQAPALHLRRLGAGGLFDTYAAMYDRVWDVARPAWTTGDT
jgi:transcriptional regulator with XRE-family HTH domain